MTVFFIVNSNNQELIHYINFLGYLFYHQSMKKKPCWFWRFLLYYFYFKIYSLNASKIYYLTKNLCSHYELFLQQYFIHILCFFNLSTTIYQSEYIFRSNWAISSIATPIVSAFALTSHSCAWIIKDFD